MRRWLPVSLIVGAWIFSIAVYSRLPDRVPVHWDIAGEPNRYGSRLEGAFLLPAMMLVLYIVFQWYPSRDPRAQNITKFRGAYDIVVTAMVALLAGIHALALGYALGWRVDITTIALVGMGAMLTILGNFLPRARSNFIFGIRTPWTLSSESVWMRSHRVGGYSMVAAGLLAMVSAFFARPVGVVVALVALFISGLIPIVYSYVIWSRERGRTGPG